MTKEHEAVVWDAPDGKGGWISQAWCTGCDWKADQNYNREAVEQAARTHVGPKEGEDG